MYEPSDWLVLTPLNLLHLTDTRLTVRRSTVFLISIDCELSGLVPNPFEAAPKGHYNSEALEYVRNTDHPPPPFREEPCLVILVWIFVIQYIRERAIWRSFLSRFS
jgi:hypothetical protein